MLTCALFYSHLPATSGSITSVFTTQLRDGSPIVTSLVEVTIVFVGLIIVYDHLFLWIVFDFGDRSAQRVVAEEYWAKNVVMVDPEDSMSVCRAAMVPEVDCSCCFGNDKYVQVPPGASVRSIQFELTAYVVVDDVFYNLRKMERILTNSTTLRTIGTSE
jgi:hypothetical protein